MILKINYFHMKNKQNQKVNNKKKMKTKTAARILNKKEHLLCLSPLKSHFILHSLSLSPVLIPLHCSLCTLCLYIDRKNERGFHIKDGSAVQMGLSRLCASTSLFQLWRCWYCCWRWYILCLFLHFFLPLSVSLCTSFRIIYLDSRRWISGLILAFHVWDLLKVNPVA